MTLDAFRHYLKQTAAQHGSQRKAAECWGIAPAYLNDVIRGYRSPGPKLLKAVGYRLVCQYEQAEGVSDGI